MSRQHMSYRVSDEYSKFKDRESNKVKAAAGTKLMDRVFYTIVAYKRCK